MNQVNNTGELYNKAVYAYCNAVELTNGSRVVINGKEYELIDVEKYEEDMDKHYLEYLKEEYEKDAEQLKYTTDSEETDHILKSLSEDYDEYMEYLADQYEYGKTLTLLEEQAHKQRCQQEDPVPYAFEKNGNATLFDLIRSKGIYPEIKEIASISQKSDEEMREILKNHNWKLIIDGKVYGYDEAGRSCARRQS
jgi:hypothetical protein